MNSPKPKGGRRPGSGRPRVDSVGVNFRLRRETLEWIDAQDGRRSEVIERLINKKRGTEMKAIDTVGVVHTGTLQELIRKGAVHLESQRKKGRLASWHIQTEEGKDIEFTSDLVSLKKSGYSPQEIAERFIKQDMRGEQS